MDDPIHVLLVAVGFLSMVTASGAALVFGMALVCRWMKWAPMNITVNVFKPEDQ